MEPFSSPDLNSAKAAIANAVLDALPDAALGTVTLRHTQRFSAARARQLVDRHDGCLVAEDVGRGKTFIALSIAVTFRSVLVVAPAALRATWNDSARRAAVPIAFVSIESLSRSSRPRQDGHDLVIVDEAHHFRNPGTRRYAALAALVTDRRVLLLSATPLQNRINDLRAQVALFIGEAAFALDAAALSTFIVRGAAGDDADMPRVLPPLWIDAGIDEQHVLSAILALPDPARPLDGGDAGALRMITLVRAWSSSRAALQATIRNRRRLAVAIESGIESGRLPTRQESLAWFGSREAVQLGFASLLASHSVDSGELAEIRANLTLEHSALDELDRRLRESPDGDIARAGAISALRDRHPGERIIVFTEFASTAERLFALLVAHGGVGLSTARASRIASGRLSRDELLARFAPVAQRSARFAAHESVTLLLTTDLLSEGVNLQDASVVVHMDLPWNPARLAQRVGRVRRPGGASEVQSCLLRPPASAEALLRCDRLLRNKLARAGTAIGTSFDVLPVLAENVRALDGSTQPGHAEREGVLSREFESWRGPMGATSQATVHSREFVWLAALSDGSLLSSSGDSVDDVLEIVAMINESTPCAPISDFLTRARQQVESRIATLELGILCGLRRAVGPMRRELGRWLTATAHSPPRHEREAILQKIANLRPMLDQLLPIGIERQLHAIVREHSPADSLALVEGILVKRRLHPKPPLTIVALIVGIPRPP